MQLQGGRGNPAGVVVNGNASTRCFNIDSAGAILDGVTVSNGQWTSDGSGLWLNSGTVTNCVITDCRNFRAVNQVDGTLALSTGPVRNPAGQPIARFNSIWRQEAPGVWRIVFDKGQPYEP